jgi:hypothetical protein
LQKQITWWVEALRLDALFRQRPAAWEELAGPVDRGAHRRLRERRMVKELRAALHMRELEVQHGNTAGVEPVRHRSLERMLMPASAPCATT